MNILHIDTEKGWGGGQNQLALLIKGLSKNANVPIKNFLAAKNESKICSSVIPHIEEVINLPFWGEVDLYSAYKLSQLVKQRKIDVISCHTGHAHGLGLFIKKFVPTVKLVVHKRVAFPLARGVLNRYKYLSPKIDHYIAVCDAIKQNLIQYGVSQNKITIIPSSIDESEFSFNHEKDFKAQLAKDFGFSLDVPLMLCANRLTKEKGMETLIDACHILKKKNVLFHCLIVGSGALLDKLKATTEELSLKSEISFVGFRTDTPKFMSASDIFILPSFMEGRGTSLLEALYAGCFLVGSNVGGIPEIIKNESIGKLFKPGDAVELADTLEAAIKRRPEKRVLRSMGREIVQDNSLEKAIKKHIDLYQSL